MEQHNIRSDDNEPNQNNSLYNNFYDTDLTSITGSSNQTTQNFNNYHYICKQCSKFPSIILTDNNEKIILKCNNTEHYLEKKLDEFINAIKPDNTDNINKHQYCQEHNKKIIKVCIDCKLNLCEQCKHEDNHQIKRYEDLKEENKYLINFLNNYATELIQKEIYKTKKDSNSNSNYRSINEMLRSKDEKEKYNIRELTENFNEISNERLNLSRLIKIILSDIDIIPNYIHFENLKKLNYLFDNKLILEYKTQNNNLKKIRLFGKEFVNNNKNNCSLIINGEIKELREEYELTNINTNLIITLLKTNYITDMSHMFDNCDNLLSISDDSKWITNEVENMSNMFNNCKSLVSLPKIISEWDTSKVKDMYYMFNGCKSLPILPDISNWNTNEVKNMSFMFSDCLKLEILKNIFKWNTSKVEDMSNMFSNCKSLKIFDDYDNKPEKWDTSNVSNFGNMFNGCERLERVTENISKWDVENVKYMNSMFCNCKSLKSLPDGIANWNTKNLVRINFMFKNCSSLTKLPDITKWDISNLEDIYEMIDGCDSLKEKDLPDFSKWINNKNETLIYIDQKLEKYFNKRKKEEEKRDK